MTKQANIEADSVIIVNSKHIIIADGMNKLCFLNFKIDYNYNNINATGTLAAKATEIVFDNSLSIITLERGKKATNFCSGRPWYG